MLYSRRRGVEGGETLIAQSVSEGGDTSVPLDGGGMLDTFSMSPRSAFTYPAGQSYPKDKSP